MTTDKLLSRAEVFEKKQELDRLRTEEGLSRFQSKKDLETRINASSLAELEAKKDDKHALRIIGSLERDAKLIRQAIPFINDTLTAISPLCPGALYLIGAASGTGKSTTVAAMAHALYSKGMNSFIISNEETEAKVVARIACIEVGVDFNLYIQDKVPSDIRKQVAHQISKITEFVTVADDPVVTTTIEGIQKLLNEVEESGRYACIMIDFMQRINKSIVVPTAERTDVLYRFKDIITDYAQHAKTPVIMMTQLIPLASDEAERNVETRIKWAKGVYEAASTVIEVIKLKGLPVSTFYMAKRRFGTADVSVSCKFDNGKFSYLSKQDLQKLKEETAMNNLREMVKDVGSNENMHKVSGPEEP